MARGLQQTPNEGATEESAAEKAAYLRPYSKTGNFVEPKIVESVEGAASAERVEERAAKAEADARAAAESEEVRQSSLSQYAEFRSLIVMNTPIKSNILKRRAYRGGRALRVRSPPAQRRTRTWRVRCNPSTTPD